MKYLLSSGRSTTNIIEYVKDLILINMKLLPKEIPYYQGGTEELIKDVLEDNLIPNIRLIVKNLIDRLILKIPNVKIELDSVELNSKTVTVKIKINNIVEVYDISRSY